MARALKACSQLGCPNLTRGSYCDEHTPEPWQRSKPRSTLSGWKQQQRARRVIRRDGGICHVCGLPGADQADHVIPTSEGGEDTEANMRAIHSLPCHRDKTLAEAQRARARAR